MQELPRGWVPLGGYEWFTAALTLSAVPTGFIAWYSAWSLFQFGISLDPEMDFSLRILTGIATLLAAIAAGVLIQRIRVPRPFANFDTDRVRFGRHECGMSDVVWAQFVVTGSVKRPGVSMLIGTKGRARAAFRLRTATGTLIDPTTARLVGEVLRRSAVEMPKDRYDPSGRFAKANFPTNLTREEAVEAVLFPAEFDPDSHLPPVHG